MGYQEYDWNDILEKCALIVAETLKPDNKKGVIKTLGQLYKELQKSGKHVPALKTFQLHMRNELGIDAKQKIVSEELAIFAGRYEALTLEEMIKHVNISSAAHADECKWLFFHFEPNKHQKEKDDWYIEEQKYMRKLSEALRKKYSQDILFISSDPSTLIVLCKNSSARERIAKDTKRIQRRKKALNRRLSDV